MPSLRLRFDRIVNPGVEKADDIAVDAQGSWDPDRRAERARHPLGNACFAVPRVSEQEHAAARIDRGAEPVQQPGRHDQVGKGPLEILLGGVLLGDGLSGHRLEIVGQRDRGRAKIGAFLGVAAGPLAAKLRDGEVVVAHLGRPLESDELLLFQLLQDRIDDLERQPHLVGDGAPARGPFGQQELQNQALDLFEGEARFFQGFRRLGAERLAWVLIPVSSQERVDAIEQLGEPRVPLDVVAEVRARRGPCPLARIFVRGVVCRRWFPRLRLKHRRPGSEIGKIEFVDAFRSRRGDVFRRGLTSLQSGKEFRRSQFSLKVGHGRAFRREGYIMASIGQTTPLPAVQTSGTSLRWHRSYLEAARRVQTRPHSPV